MEFITEFTFSGKINQWFYFFNFNSILIRIRKKWWKWRKGNRAWIILSSTASKRKRKKEATEKREGEREREKGRSFKPRKNYFSTTTSQKINSNGKIKT